MGPSYRVSRLARVAALALASGAPIAAQTVATEASAQGQRPTVVRSLVFDGVTVVDVEQGKRVPNQRVLIAGSRIQAVGAAPGSRFPRGRRSSTRAAST